MRTRLEKIKTARYFFANLSSAISHGLRRKFISVRILRFVSQVTQARRYFVSGSVQGVGFRYFTQRAAEDLGISGYVRNLRDGRVEVYAFGSAENLSRFKTILDSGPSFSSVGEIREQPAIVDMEFENKFVILPTN
jgi:acylphosphatase